MKNLLIALAVIALASSSLAAGRNKAVWAVDDEKKPITGVDADGNLFAPGIVGNIKLGEEIELGNGARIVNGDTNTVTITGKVVVIDGSLKLKDTVSGGSVAADALSNLPTGAATNAEWLKLLVGTNSYCVPMYKLP